MTDITIEALKLRERELQINIAMNQGAIEELRHIIAEMERRRGGRPRKTAEVAIISQRVAGGVHEEPETDEQDDVAKSLKSQVHND
jgi:hypothetical protein